jgi:hypothetical protein
MRKCSFGGETRVHLNTSRDYGFFIPESQWIPPLKGNFVSPDQLETLFTCYADSARSAACARGCHLHRRNMRAPGGL